MNETIVVLVTAGSSEEAERIARSLVEERLAACVNIVPAVRSFFRWEGAVQDAAETLLICKTGRDRLGPLTERVKSLHSYTVPEVIALPVVGGLPSYLAWVRASLEG